MNIVDIKFKHLELDVSIMLHTSRIKKIHLNMLSITVNYSLCRMLSR